MPKISKLQPHAETVKALAAAGHTSTYISQQLGIKPATLIESWLRYHNYPRHPRSPPRGERNPAWRGGRKIVKHGYIALLRPDHPDVDSHGYVLEHRLVMEKLIGRRLKKKEVVHHKDGDNQNNSPDNLELFADNAAHLRAELTGRCPKWTEAGKAAIRKGIEKSIATRRRKAAERRAQREAEQVED